MRVLDLTDEHVVYSTKLLADLGAEVIRLEPPDPDSVRRFRLREEQESERERVDGNTFHAYFNAGKRSVALDLTTSEGLALFEQLCSWADVVVEGLRAWGLSDELYARCCEANPALVWVAAREFAPETREKPKTTEIVRFALSGLMSITGAPSQPPMLVGGGLSNAVVSVNVAVAAYLGFISAQKTRQGGLIWVSAYEALVNIMQQDLFEAAFTHRAGKRCGSRHRHVAVAGASPCKDGFFVVSANEPANWRSLVEMVGDERLMDEHLNDEQRRKQQTDYIFELIAQWSAGSRKNEVAEAGQARRIPMAPVHDSLDVLHDPHLRARRVFQVVDNEEVAVLRAPWSEPVRPAPRLGQHTSEVVKEFELLTAARKGS